MPIVQLHETSICNGELRTNRNFREFFVAEKCLAWISSIMYDTLEATIFADGGDHDLLCLNNKEFITKSLPKAAMRKFVFGGVTGQIYVRYVASRIQLAFFTFHCCCCVVRVSNL